MMLVSKCIVFLLQTIAYPGFCIFDLHFFSHFFFRFLFPLDKRTLGMRTMEAHASYLNLPRETEEYKKNIPDKDSAMQPAYARSFLSTGLNVMHAPFLRNRIPCHAQFLIICYPVNSISEEEKNRGNMRIYLGGKVCVTRTRPRHTMRTHVPLVTTVATREIISRDGGKDVSHSFASPLKIDKPPSSYLGDSLPSPFCYEAPRL